MKITESKFSEMEHRAEKGEEEDTKKRAVVQPLQEIQRAEQAENDLNTPANSLLERNEEGPVTMSKEAPGQSARPEQDAETRLGILPEPASNELTTPAASSAAPSENSTRPANAPRKNVIPPRRNSFENGNRAPQVVKRNTWSAESVQSAESGQQPEQQALPAAPEASGLQKHQESSRNTADLPTQTTLPAISPDTLANQQPQALEMPASWQAVQEMPLSWRAEQGAPTLSATEPAWGKTPALPDIESAWGNLDKHEDTRSNEEHIQQTAAIETHKIAVPNTPRPAAMHAGMSEQPTTPLPLTLDVKPLPVRRDALTRGRALFLVALLAILVINVSATGFNRFFGSQGWGSVFNNSNSSGQNLLGQLRQHIPTPGATGQPTVAPLTPTQIANELLAKMSLDEKLGQMMMVQFTGPEYSLQLSAMISQYKIGSVLVFAANGNIVSKPQLTGLISQMQQNAFLPLTVSIDQEGGTVDRLINLDGPQPAAATIGATGDPNQAYQQGVKDAQDLSSYGFNLNLAPVVDVTNVYNPQMYDRTYGNNPAIVTSMAGAYLQGLQKSGKVLGTLKHFPGLGDVSVDPHYRPPDLTRSLNDLDTIDWAPYSALIKQGDVYAIMVTHEYVKALDSSEPSSLSPQVIGVLRNQMHFQGVIMTDSLTMDSIHNYYSYGQAAAKAIEAGDDILMGATSPNDVAQMIDGIKQAISSGAISEQQIDDAVRRILILKYEMGLLHV